MLYSIWLYHFIISENILWSSSSRCLYMYLLGFYSYEIFTGTPWCNIAQWFLHRLLLGPSLSSEFNFTTWLKQPQSLIIAELPVPKKEWVEVDRRRWQQCFYKRCGCCPVKLPSSVWWRTQNFSPKYNDMAQGKSKSSQVSWGLD